MTHKEKLAAVLMIFLSLAAVRAEGQNLVAYHVVGNVTYKAADGGGKPLVMNTRVTGQTVVNIPYGGKLELLDEGGSRRLTLKRPGKGTVNALAQGEGNSISKLSGQYVAYVKKQLTNRGLTSRQRYTDFATVTRKRDSLRTEDSGGQADNPFAKAFGEFKKSSRETFDSFRDRCNREYAEFVRKAWEKLDSSPAVSKPSEPRVAPVEYKGGEHGGANNRRKEKAIVEDFPDAGPQPRPVEDIPSTEPEESEREFAYMPFTLFGTDMQVRLDETKRFNVGEANPGRVADMLLLLSGKDYDNLLYDCLSLRKSRKLCDWAYLLMLKEISDQFCGEGTSEAALLTGWLFMQSGYKVRFAADSARLHTLVATRHNIYGRASYGIDGETFYPLDDISGRISICKAKFPGEQSLSLYIRDAQDFAGGEGKERTVRSRRYPGVAFSVKVNTGIIDFYNSYPTSYINDDFTTRWAMYADTPVEESVRSQFYSKLGGELAGLSDVEAVERLLNLVQTGFEYAYDDDVWGGDRAFFAEETLYYPSCDCEDRAILFTRLVRDLLGLDCVLVYYPGHLAAAVCFDAPAGASGDFFTLKGKDYYVCDPTYINAGIGMSMPGMDDGEAILIPTVNTKKQGDK